jgi:Fe-only nitrogenase delta subunit
METTQEDLQKDRIAQLEDYIMKNCLWQFHSRVWDRERQNREILLRTTQILCNQPAAHETLEDRCYWADAVCLTEAFRSRYPWLCEMSVEEITSLMEGVKDRIDLITYKGSLNKELTDQHY